MDDPTQMIIGTDARCYFSPARDDVSRGSLPRLRSCLMRNSVLCTLVSRNALRLQRPSVVAMPRQAVRRGQGEAADGQRRRSGD